MPKPQKSKSVKRPKCNCHLWALIGSYVCPEHGNQNIYRQKEGEVESMNWTSFLLGAGAMSVITTVSLVWIAVRGNENKRAAYRDYERDMQKLIVLRQDANDILRDIANK